MKAKVTVTVEREDGATGTWVFHDATDADVTVEPVMRRIDLAEELLREAMLPRSPRSDVAAWIGTLTVRADRVDVTGTPA